MEDGKVEKKREATCLTNAGQAVMGKFWCDGESQRKYRQSVSHEKKVQSGLGCCSSIAVKSLKLVVSACSGVSKMESHRNS